MRDAAVGFQCPDCVREAARQTRQGRTPYGGRVRGGPPVVTKLRDVEHEVAAWRARRATAEAARADAQRDDAATRPAPFWRRWFGAGRRRAEPEP